MRISCSRSDLVALMIYYTYSTDAATISKVGKILIDTDAGADDAVAIIMALQAEKLNGEQEIVGITCVNGNTYVDNVALNVLKTLKVVDRLDVGELCPHSDILIRDFLYSVFFSDFEDNEFKFKWSDEIFYAI